VTTPDLEAIEIASADDVPPGTPFEAAQAALAHCVERLESGEAGLDEAVRVYRRGAALRDYCERRLAAIRAEIEELTVDGQGDGAPPPPGDAPF
jgi:exodeoxyribonuclease VII small subunit